MLREDGRDVYYVVTMQRWGDSEAHNYVIGVFSDYWLALHAGEVERAWRGGKYEALITPHTVDLEIDDEKEAWYEECTTGEFRNKLRKNYRGEDRKIEKT